MGNRSRTHTPVNLENQACIGKLKEIRSVVDWCITIASGDPMPSQADIQRQRVQPV
jgi:hypothetical protein